MRLGLLGDLLGVVEMPAVVAGEHEHDAAQAAIGEDARGLDQNELALGGIDASGHQDHALAAPDLPAAPQHHGAFRADRRRIEARAFDAARDDREFFARHLVARRDLVRHVVGRHDHAVAGGERLRIGLVATLHA